MEVYKETNMLRIKQKMTEIRRSKKAPIMHNYYLNCEQDEEIYVLYGQSTVVFWNGNGEGHHAYFYSNDAKELVRLLLQVPEGTVIDYFTHTEGKLQELLESAGWRLIHEMRRMISGSATPEGREKMAKRRKAFDIALYKKDNVRPAEESDCDAIYKKLSETIDSRESRLCTKEELLEYIRNRWVAVYYEAGELLGFRIFTVKDNTANGYHIWNNAGPEGYYSLVKVTDQLLAKYMQDIPPEKIKPNYCWVDAKNKKAIRIDKFWGMEFDGLRNFVYEKLPTSESAQ